jgi:phosphate transport system permease protein
MLKDRMFAATMAIGGISVIIAIVMIFFYLFYVVVPMFASARMEAAGAYQLPYKGSDIARLTLDEYAEIGLAVSTTGDYTFFRATDGVAIEQGTIAHSDGHEVVASAGGDPATHTFYSAYKDGSAVVIRAAYAIAYPNDKRAITPSLTYPLGPEPIDLGLDGAALRKMSAQSNAEETTIVAITESNDIVLTYVVAEESLLGDEVNIEVTHARLAGVDFPIETVLVDVGQRELYVASPDGQLGFFDIQDKSAPVLIDRLDVVDGDHRLTAMESLAGGISVLVGDSSGRISQWFPVRDEGNNYSLKHVREFTAFESSVSRIEPEYFRKGFAATDSDGNIGLFHTTAERVLLVDNIATGILRALAICPRANALLAVDDSGAAQYHVIHNEHPEVSWRSLWGKVWYESRAEPEYIWQSSSASSDFEPKFSLTPLTFGTIKAAFYAMLFAIPLAILGAVYTAYFMTPKMRNFVKPSIEVMAALPTVILGFLAGLWLAPLIEQYLAGVFLSFVLVPLSFVFASFLADRLPRRLHVTGWEAAVLIPVVCLGMWLSLTLSAPIETLLFDGNLPLWLTSQFGITYDQRNSLVVGMAIGFAVIPTIFSISEDAVFGVPRHLTSGSLALGATPWQTVVGVVILTASPGIFSAVMIGLGRAVGETMIVLMATGNTPIMDMNIFQGFRALSANIAVEMPESEVGSTHFRVLFLAALVLFLVTFVVNTAAEIVRQRLRVKYSNL